jgi:hypothetical protein
MSASTDYYRGLGSVRIDAADDQRVSVDEVFIDGIGAANAVDPAPSQELVFDTRGFADGPHQVVAYTADPAGHRVPSLPATIRVDNVNPLGLLTSPTYGAKVTGSFVARVYVTDPNGIMGTFFIANDRVVGGFTGAGWGQVTVPVTKAGPIRVVALTVDSAGRISGTNTAVVTGVVAKRRGRR